MGREPCHVLVTTALTERAWYTRSLFMNQEQTQEFADDIGDRLDVGPVRLTTKINGIIQANTRHPKVTLGINWDRWDEIPEERQKVEIVYRLTRYRHRGHSRKFWDLMLSVIMSLDPGDPILRETAKILVDRDEYVDQHLNAIGYQKEWLEVWNTDVMFINEWDGREMSSDMLLYDEFSDEKRWVTLRQLIRNNNRIPPISGRAEPEGIIIESGDRWVDLMVCKEEKWIPVQL
jgi:hypothetical protein